MVEFFVLIIFLLIVASIICLFIGLVNPSLFKVVFKKNLGRGKTTAVFAGVAFVLFIIFGGLGEFIPSTSSQQKNPVEKQLQTIRRIVVTPTMTQQDILLSHEKKLKAIDDQMITHDFKMATKCALIINDVANGNVSSLSDWSTADDLVYERLFSDRTAELNAIDDSKEGSASAGFATWSKLPDIDGTIDNDLGNTEGVCDNFVTDPLAQSNAGMYESEVKSDQGEVSILMEQRKSILTQLGY